MKLPSSQRSRLIRNKTVLIIAHRMRTVAGADKIVVLSEGCVAEEGTPDELYQKDGIYSHMVKLVTIHGLGPLIVTVRGDIESLLRKIAPHS